MTTEASFGGTYTPFNFESLCFCVSAISCLSFNDAAESEEPSTVLQGNLQRMSEYTLVIISNLLVID